MDLLAFDYGDKRIGYSVGDRRLNMAFAKGYLINGKSLITKISTLIKKTNPHLLIAGLPLKKDMSFTPATDKAVAFVKRLDEEVDLPVYLVDERYTTSVSLAGLRQRGKNAKKSKELVDAESARNIALTYINGASWTFRYHNRKLDEAEISNCLRRYDTINQNEIITLYCLGAEGIFELLKNFSSKWLIYELHPYFFSKERHKQKPENLIDYRFAFSADKNMCL